MFLPRRRRMDSAVRHARVDGDVQGRGERERERERETSWKSLQSSARTEIDRLHMQKHACDAFVSSF